MIDQEAGVAVARNRGVEEQDKTSEYGYADKYLRRSEAPIENDDSHSDISVSSGTSNIPLSCPTPPSHSSGRLPGSRYKSLRQWVVSSFSSTTIEEPGEWCCQHCSYQNADPTCGVCALCGRNRHNIISTVNPNKGKKSQSHPSSGGTLHYLMSYQQESDRANTPPTARPPTVSASSGSSNGSNKENAGPPTCAPEETDKASITGPRVFAEPAPGTAGRSPSVSVDSTASTVIASNLEAVPSEHGPAIPSLSLLGPFLGQDENSIDMGLEDDMLPVPNIVVGKPTTPVAVSVLTDEESLNRPDLCDDETPTSAPQSSGPGTEKGCGYCSNRMLLLWLTLLIILAAVVTILVILLRDGGGQQRSTDVTTPLKSPDNVSQPTIFSPTESPIP